MEANLQTTNQQTKMSARIVKKRVLVMKCQFCEEYKNVRFMHPKDGEYACEECVPCFECKKCLKPTRADEYITHLNMCDLCVGKEMMKEHKMKEHKYAVYLIRVSEELYDGYLAYHTTESINQKIKQSFQEEDYLEAYVYYPTSEGMVWIINTHFDDEDEYLPIYFLRWHGKYSHPYIMGELLDDYDEDQIMRKNILEIKNMCSIEYAHIFDKAQ